jgi:rubrerythrin
VDFYTRLLFDAPNSLHKEFIEEAKDEEAKHLIVFTKLYQLLTNQIPSYTLTPVNYANYKEGLLIALKDELEAADLYKEMILSTNDARIKDAFFYAMGDELEHSVMFSTLYNTV